MASKRTYHVIVPATGEAIEYQTTGKEYAFAAIVYLPADPTSDFESRRVAGWHILKRSATEKGASAIGQTKRHAEYLKSLPHAVVPIFHGPAPVVEDAPVCGCCGNAECTCADWDVVEALEAEEAPAGPRHYSYNDILELAGEKDADGWRHATITLREGDTATDPGSTKKGFAGKGTIEYHIHPTSLCYKTSEGIHSIYLR